MATLYVLQSHAKYDEDDGSFRREKRGRSSVGGGFLWGRRPETDDRRSSFRLDTTKDFSFVFFRPRENMGTWAGVKEEIGRIRKGILSHLLLRWGANPSLFDSSSFSSRWEGGIPIPLSSSSSSSVRKRPVASILGSKLGSPFALRFILRSILDLCLLANDHGGRKKKKTHYFPPSFNLLLIVRHSEMGLSTVVSLFLPSSLAGGVGRWGEREKRKEDDSILG